MASSNDRELIQRFNSRLVSGGISYRLPVDPSLPGEKEFRRDGHPVFRELLIVEDGEEMRAGVLLQHGTFFIRGQQRPFCWLQLPLSEGLVDHTHSAAFVFLMRQTLRRVPFAASLGIGSMQEPYARYLVGARWQHQPVPFVFYPLRPGRVARELQPLRRTSALRAAGNVLGHSGLGAALGGALGVHRSFAAGSGSYTAMEVPGWGGWCDRIFEANLPKYDATVRRDAASLSILYPPSESQYIRLRVQNRRTGDDLGWLLLLNAQMSNNKYFGNLKVGTIVTGFGDPAATSTLIHAGLTHLAERGADLVVANWSHKAWLHASRKIGFLPGPSNFFFFVSPRGTPLLDLTCPLGEIHLTRGDCDAPTSLMAPRSATNP